MQQTLKHNHARYDALYRLTSASTTGSTNYPIWGLSETYDRYGNRWAQGVTAGTGVPSNSVTIDATKNRITDSPYAYDASGNMTNDGSNTLAYDAENHAVSATNGSASGAYTYDGGGLRIKKVSGSTRPSISSLVAKSSPNTTMAPLWAHLRANTSIRVRNAWQLLSAALPPISTMT